MDNGNKASKPPPQPPTVGSMASGSKSTIETLRSGLSLFRPFGGRSSQCPSPVDFMMDEGDGISIKDPLHQHKLGHRRVDETGQITYKRCPLDELRSALQLGIECVVASAQAKFQRDVLLQDFSQIMLFEFPAQGTRITPAHRFKDFTFKAYAPVAFQHFRNKFGIKSTDFLVSLCKDEWREVPNPGASGSVFYLSSDDRFIVKTVQAKEAQFLLQLLPGYYMNLVQNPDTLLPKFFGLYCYQRLDKNIRVIVMNNLIPSNVSIVEKYDLKGSSYKRRASEKERRKTVPTLKDLDFRDKFPSGIQMEPRVYNRLMNTLQKDLRVLSSFEIMDYSLLVGISRPKRFPAQIDGIVVDGRQPATEHERVDKVNRVYGLNLETPAVKLRSSSIPPSRDTINEDYRAPKTVCRLLSSTEYDNWSIADNLAGFRDASDDRRSMRDEHDSTKRPRLSVSEAIASHGVECYNQNQEMAIFLGIIDILQCYRLKKRLEHALKTTVLARDEISICHPRQYATRFYRFLSRIAFRKRLSILRLPPSYDSMTLTSTGYFSSGLDTINTQPTFHSEEVASNITRSSCSSINSGLINNNYHVIGVSSPWWATPPLTSFTGSTTIDRDSGVHTSDSRRSRNKR